MPNENELINGDSDEYIIIEKNYDHEVRKNIQTGFVYKEYVCPPKYFFDNYFEQFKHFRYLMAIFMEIVEKENITWFLDYGALISYIREDGLPIPWDFDLDLYVDANSLKKFEKYHMKRFGKYHKNIFLYSHTSEVDSGNSCFWTVCADCRERKTFWKTSHCCFCNPYAKLLFEYTEYCPATWDELRKSCLQLDIFGYKPRDNVNNQIEEKHKGKFVRNFDKESVYPLIYEGKFVGFENLPLPRDYKKWLSKIYGDYMKRPYKCDIKTKKWVKND